jgi:hypothetical protein
MILNNGTRMRFACTLALLFMLIQARLSAQTEVPTVPPSFEFLPGTSLFPPLVANPQEVRVGVRKEIGSSRLKLDIGSALDWFEVRLNASGTDRLRMGSDLFTYALTTSAQGLRLQVDAVDGFFGGHFSYLHSADSWSLGLRLRMMHLSAHLIDGHFDNQTMMWKDGRLPIPFTRDSGELTAALSSSIGPLPFRLYSGFTLAVLVRPSDIRRFSTLHGFECTSGSLLGTALGKPFQMYAAFNLTLVGIPAYVGTSVSEFGIKLGQWNGSGLRFYVNYASGMEFFSEYYDVRRDMAGVGFAFDLW